MGAAERKELCPPHNEVLMEWFRNRMLIWGKRRFELQEQIRENMRYGLTQGDSQTHLKRLL